MSASTGLIAFVLFLPGIFVEHSCSGLQDPSEKIVKTPEETVKTNQRAKKQSVFRRELLNSSISVVDGQLMEDFGLKEKTKTKSSNERPNVLATIATTYNFFSFLFNFVLLETWVLNNYVSFSIYKEFTYFFKTNI